MWHRLRKGQQLWKQIPPLSQRAFTSAHSASRSSTSHDTSPPGQQAAQQCDMVGPPDPVSNMRPFRLRPPASEAEEELQKVQEETWSLNHNFWAKHNTEFEQRKAAFVQEVLKKKRAAGQISEETSKLTADELSVFYKDFLDSKFQDQMTFSRKWMKLNLLHTWSHLKYRLHILFGYKK